MLGRLTSMFGRLTHLKPHPPEPEPLSQEVLERIARDYPESERAGVAQVLAGYRVPPVNLVRLCVLNAVKGVASDVARFVEVGNRYGLGTVYWNGSAPGQGKRGTEAASSERGR